MFFRIVPALVLLSLLLCAGCTTVHNDYLRPEDFGRYAEAEGLKIEKSFPLPTGPFRASSGHSYTIAGREVWVYKYDRTVAVQRERLQRFVEEGRTYYIGVPLPIEVRGSFMFLLLEKHPEKQRLLKAIDKFY